MPRVDGCGRDPEFWSHTMPRLLEYGLRYPNPRQAAFFKEDRNLRICQPILPVQSAQSLSPDLNLDPTERAIWTDSDD